MAKVIPTPEFSEELQLVIQVATTGQVDGFDQRVKEICVTLDLIVVHSAKTNGKTTWGLRPQGRQLLARHATVLHSALIACMK